MSLWVKICGNTTLEDAEAAALAGADAVGFVFAPSPRQVTAETAAGIVAVLGGRVESIGVFVEERAEAIAEIVEHCGLTGVQLHGGAEAGTTAKLLRTHFGARLRILRVVHLGEGGTVPAEAVEAIAAIGAEGACDAVLIDTRVSGKAGGTGVAFDWGAAAETVFVARDGMRRVAAGGLKPENVAEAIGLLRPWGVDVASGVEARPGAKDHARVREFVRRARMAAEALE
jgi:phosphoribosylanthranilate isomerase